MGGAAGCGLWERRKACCVGGKDRQVLVPKETVMLLFRWSVKWEVRGVGWW